MTAAPVETVEKPQPTVEEAAEVVVVPHPVVVAGLVTMVQPALAQVVVAAAVWPEEAEVAAPF